MTVVVTRAVAVAVVTSGGKNGGGKSGGDKSGGYGGYKSG